MSKKFYGKNPPALQSEIEHQMLTGLNDFMKKFDIPAINFGSHGVKKTKGKKSKPYHGKL